MGDSDQSLAKIKINILCSPLVHQAGHFVIDSYQVGQAIISFCKSRLTTPNHCLVLSVLGIGFQYNFPIKFPRIKVRLTGLQCSVSSCLSLKIEVTFAFFHFLGLSPNCLELLKMMKSSLTMTLASCLSTSVCIPLVLMALCISGLFKISLTWFSPTQG